MARVASKPLLGPGSAAWQQRAFHIIFEADTPAGRGFDLGLLAMIVLSVLVVSLETVQSYARLYGPWFRLLEWTITVAFTLEYFLRLAIVSSPGRYALSFFGLVDLLSIIPTYLSLVISGSQYLSVVRALRLLRVFRVLKLTHFIDEGSVLAHALVASRHKIAVFLFTVVNAVIVIGAIMYLVEGPEHGFTSIPVSIYWAIVTLTTVGYGDIAPQTQLGQIIACVVMILGYGIIAVPTGIVTVELSQQGREERALRERARGRCCQACGQPLPGDESSLPQRPVLPAQYLHSNAEVGDAVGQDGCGQSSSGARGGGIDHPGQGSCQPVVMQHAKRQRREQHGHRGQATDFHLLEGPPLQSP